MFPNGAQLQGDSERIEMNRNESERIGMNRNESERIGTNRNESNRIGNERENDPGSESDSIAMNRIRSVHDPE